MGTWGAGLYADDTTCEVRDEFRSHLSAGLPPGDAETRLFARYDSLLIDKQVACLFYFSLADTQWKFGCLSTRVKERAMALLEAGADLKYWAVEAPEELSARKRTLASLRKRIESPQRPWSPPPLKKERQRRSQLELPVGSVLRLELSGEAYALLKLVGFLPVGNVDTALFRLLPWKSKKPPTREALAEVSEQWVLIHGHHEFSILIDGRKKLTSLLQPTGIVLESTTAIDLGTWRAIGDGILSATIDSALAGQ